MNISEFTAQAAKIAITGIAGAVVSRSSQQLSQQIEKKTGWHLGEALNAVIPQAITNKLKLCTKIIQFPLQYSAHLINNFYVNEPYNLEKIDSQELEKRARRVGALFEQILAPLSEELIYRGLIQKGGAELLQTCGLPPILAKAISSIFATLMFGLAHIGPTENFDSTKFTQSATAGIIMAVINERFGLHQAGVTHMIHNTFTTMERAHRKRNQRVSFT
jgi:hypothetical protein